MSLHASRTRLCERDRSDDLFAAFAAISLAGLNRRSTCVAEHKSFQSNSCPRFYPLSSVIRSREITVPASATIRERKLEKYMQTKRPPGNWAAFSSRENSSNGGLNSVKTFCRNLMSQKTGVSSDFWEINASVINNLQNGLTFPKTVAF